MDSQDEANHANRLATALRGRKAAEEFLLELQGKEFPNQSDEMIDSMKDWHAHQDEIDQLRKDR
jgi:hypothetical protein